MNTRKIFLFFFTFLLMSASVLAQSITVTPIPAEDNDALTCRVDGVNDPFYIYQWDKMGVSDTPLETNPLPASNTEPGDNWRCKVFVPSYPANIAVPGSANVTISGDEPEEMPEVDISITPNPAYDDNDLTCLADEENNPDFIYKWDRIGVADIAIESNPLDASETSVDDIWRCRIYLPSSPSDIQIPGDARITIREEAPPAVCTDPDGDGYGIGNQCRGEDNCPDDRNTNQSNFDEDASGDACDSDNDLDGIDDEEDNCPRGDGDSTFESLVALDRLRDQNPDQADFDSDGFGDLCDRDDDNDDVNDADDICPLGDGDDLFEPRLNARSPRDQNPSQTNTDDDEFGNVCDEDNDNDGVDDVPDNCNLISNPGQENLDGGSAGDACDGDDDNDGLGDAEDNCALGNGDSVFDPFVDMNADQTDSDGNGVGDICDPAFCIDPDSDDYGVGLTCLGADNCPDAYNPDQRDFDADGTGDVCDEDTFCLDTDGDDYGIGLACLGADNCLDVFNPSQEDTDADGIGNSCDEDFLCLDPDADDYGIGFSCSGEDNCPDVHNPDQLDSDGDGSGNVCDPDFVCLDPDADEYGTGFSCLGPDNCPDTHNPGQTDIDADGTGDACDEDFFCLDTDSDDYGIGLACLGTDNCPDDHNPGQEDTDADGIGDACDADVVCFDTDGDFYGSGAACLGPDNCPENANPTQTNFDGDAVGDACDTDNDNDGFDASADNCPLGDGDSVYEAGVDDNADQTDSDGNGIGNICDVPDTEAPVVFLHQPDNGDILHSSTVDFTYFVSDNIDVALSCTLFTDTSGIFQDDLVQTAHHLVFDELSGFADLNTFTLTDLPDGVYTWNIECVDSAGNSAFASDDFTFAIDTSVPPINGTVPHVSLEAEPVHGDAPLDVSFDPFVQGGDGALRFLWDFGDGVTSTKRSPLHYYEDDGTYTARLRVTDADGDVGTATVIITVGDGVVPAQEDKLTIRRILLASPAGNEVVYSGDELLLRLTMENTGHEELEDVRVSVAILELGVRRSAGSFDLSIGESETAVVRLEVPSYTESGSYDVHIRAGNDDVQRFRNRIVLVVEP